MTSNTYQYEQSFFVHTKGCDHCPGTAERPFKTYEQALFSAEPRTKYQRIRRLIKLTFNEIMEIIGE